MGKKIDIHQYVGKSFGYLTIISDEGTVFDSGCYRTVVKVKCDCGNTVNVLFRNIKNGTTKSCGCYRKQLQKEKFTIHGKYQEKLYSVWRNMKSRCHEPKNKSYDRYGGRGIFVCKDWIDNPEAFYDWAIANGWKDDLQIDRINNDLGYFPDNCRFITCKENNRNRRSNRLLIFNGEKKILTEWAEIMGIDRQKLIDKLRYGKSLQDVFVNKNIFQDVL